MRDGSEEKKNFKNEYFREIVAVEEDRQTKIKILKNKYLSKIHI